CITHIRGENMPLQKYVVDAVVSALLEELLLTPCDDGNAPISSSSSNDLTAWLLAEQSSPQTPALHVMFAVMTPPLVVGALPAWLLHPVALLTARFASGGVETVQLILDNDAYFCSTATNTLPASLELQLSNLRKALAPWKEKLRAQIPVQQQQRQQLPQPTTITFGVPAAFASRSAPQPAPQLPSAFDYGRSDITPDCEVCFRGCGDGTADPRQRRIFLFDRHEHPCRPLLNYNCQIFAKHSHHGRRSCVPKFLCSSSNGSSYLSQPQLRLVYPLRLLHVVYRNRHHSFPLHLTTADQTSRPQEATITFGVPAAFAARSVPQQAPQFPSAFDYGRSDITPTGGDGGFARQGGVPVAATAGFGAGGVQGGGMMFGPQSSIFQQQQQPAASQFGSSADPTRGLARYDPITTGGLPGSGPFPYAGGVGVGANIPQIFPGEPDADHLRPWTNGEGFPRGGGGGGRADMFGRGGRGGRRGFGGPPGFL
ncbi:Hypothetical protein, putative, partial [Bodo saltans]